MTDRDAQGPRLRQPPRKAKISHEPREIARPSGRSDCSCRLQLWVPPRCAFRVYRLYYTTTSRTSSPKELFTFFSLYSSWSSVKKLLFFFQRLSAFGCLPRTYRFSMSDVNPKRWFGDYNANTSVRLTGLIRIPAYEPPNRLYFFSQGLH